MDYAYIIRVLDRVQDACIQAKIANRVGDNIRIVDEINRIKWLLSQIEKDLRLG